MYQFLRGRFFVFGQFLFFSPDFILHIAPIPLRFPCWNLLIDIQSVNLNWMTSNCLLHTGWIHCTIVRECRSSSWALWETRDEQIEYQSTIIELQHKPIHKTVDDLDAVQSSVQIEMRSYSTVSSKSCLVLLAATKIEDALKKVVDKEDRAQRNKNIKFYIIWW